MSLVDWASFHVLIARAHAQVDGGMFLTEMDRTIAKTKATVPRKLDGLTDRHFHTLIVPLRL